MAHKTLQTHFATSEKNFFFNFEHYDLTIGEEFESKTWRTHTCTSQVLDPTVTYTKIPKTRGAWSKYLSGRGNAAGTY